MFVTDGQFYYFAECVLIGIVCGSVYFPICAADEILKEKRVKAEKFLKPVFDVSFVIPCCVVFKRLSLVFEFPDFRAYMAVGVAAGFLLENVSFNKTLAILFEKAYNKIGKSIARLLWRKRSVRKKIKAARIGGNGDGGSIVVRIDSGSGLSARGNGNEKKRSFKTSRRNTKVRAGNRRREQRS